MSTGGGGCVNEFHEGQGKEEVTECELFLLSHRELQESGVGKVDSLLLLKRLEECVVLEGDSVLEEDRWYLHLPVVVQLERIIAFGGIVGGEPERGRKGIAGTMRQVVKLLLLQVGKDVKEEAGSERLKLGEASVDIAGLLLHRLATLVVFLQLIPT